MIKLYREGMKSFQSNRRTYFLVNIRYHQVSETKKILFYVKRSFDIQIKEE